MNIHAVGCFPKIKINELLLNVANLDNSQKHLELKKKTGTQGCIFYAIYIRFENGQNGSVVIGIKTDYF